jgi:hypothetical protein
MIPWILIPVAFVCGWLLRNGPIHDEHRRVLLANRMILKQAARLERERDEARAHLSPKVARGIEIHRAMMSQRLADEERFNVELKKAAGVPSGNGGIPARW